MVCLRVKKLTTKCFSPPIGDCALLAGDIRLTSALNYESVTAYAVTVLVNEGGTTVKENLTVEVTNVDEAPTFGNLPKTVSVREDASRPGAVLDVTATDPEAEVVSFACSAAPSDDAFDLTCTSK